MHSRSLLPRKIASEWASAPRPKRQPSSARRGKALAVVTCTAFCPVITPKAGAKLTCLSSSAEMMYTWKLSCDHSTPSLETCNFTLELPGSSCGGSPHRTCVALMKMTYGEAQARFISSTSWQQRRLVFTKPKPSASKLGSSSWLMTRRLLSIHGTIRGYTALILGTRSSMEGATSKELVPLTSKPFSTGAASVGSMKYALSIRPGGKVTE
mmetsp:Transcript_76683/g.183711  ORF Transcript_76683/g.183711 Transcript_76683/m.183711 type:complete len:211 (-) Transcript_76683:2265-2897(-)